MTSPDAIVIFAGTVSPSRFFLALLLVYQALFLNVLVPGHTRGEITVDGKHAADGAADGAPACAACCCGKAPAKSPAVPSQRDREHCAICQYVGALTSVPVVRLTLPEMGLLELLPVPPPPAAVSLAVIPTYFACGPPVSPVRV